MSPILYLKLFKVQGQQHQATSHAKEMLTLTRKECSCLSAVELLQVGALISTQSWFYQQRAGRPLESIWRNFHLKSRADVPTAGADWNLYFEGPHGYILLVVSTQWTRCFRGVMLHLSVRKMLLPGGRSRHRLIALPSPSRWVCMCVQVCVCGTEASPDEHSWTPPQPDRHFEVDVKEGRNVCFGVCCVPQGFAGKDGRGLSHESVSSCGQ